MKMSGIYKIQSKHNPERIYIGSAIDIFKRWNVHLNSLLKNTHHSKKLQRHYNKYGRHDLMFSILICCDKENLISNEQFFIDFFNPYFNSVLTAGRGCNLGIPMSEEQKKKISIARKGIKLSAKTRLNISRGHQGLKLSKEHKDSLISSRKGKSSWNKGKQLSDEHKSKIGKKSKGRIVSKETRDKISNSKRGKKASEETKQKMRISRMKRDYVFSNN